MHYWTPSRVRGHIMVCFLALVMESTLLKLLRDKRAKASYREMLKDLEQVKGVQVEVGRAGGISDGMRRWLDIGDEGCQNQSIFNVNLQVLMYLLQRILKWA